MNKEVIISDLRECIERCNLELSVVSTQGKRLEFSVLVSNNVAVPIFYDMSKGIYTIDPMNGSSVKQYDSLEDFEKYFQTYSYTFSIFIPTCKLIAINYEQRISTPVVYSGTAGSESKGFMAKFITVDKTMEIGVTFNKNTGLYILTSVDKVGNKVQLEYEIRNELPALLYNVDMYIEDLRQLYEKNLAIDIAEVGHHRLIVSSHKDSVEVILLAERGKIYFHIVEYNAESLVEDIKIQLEDPMNMNMLLRVAESKLKEQIDAMIGSKVVVCRDIGCTEVKATVEVLDVDNEDESEIMDEADSSEKEDLDLFETEDSDLLETEDLGCQDVQFIEKPVNIVERDNNFMFSLVVYDGNVEYLRCSMRDEIYDIPIQIAKEVGVPIKRVEHVEIQTQHRGVRITKEELEKKTFAEILSEDDILCKEIISSFFD